MLNAGACRGRHLKLTRILLESPSRPFRATGSSPMLAVMNFASVMMAATSSRPSFLIFQFLSSILDTRSDVIFSLWQKEEELSTDGKSEHVQEQLWIPDVCPGQHVHDVLSSSPSSSSSFLFLVLHVTGLLLARGFLGESDRSGRRLTLDLRRHIYKRVRICPRTCGDIPPDARPTFSNSASI